MSAGGREDGVRLLELSTLVLKQVSSSRANGASERCPLAAAAVVSRPSRTGRSNATPVSTRHEALIARTVAYARQSPLGTAAADQ